MSRNALFSSSRLRIIVTLANHPQKPKLVVFVQDSSNVEDLHSEVVRRATRLNVHCTVENTILRSSGNDGAIFFDEDLLTEILDLTEDGNFVLDSLDTMDTVLRFPGYASPPRAFSSSSSYNSSLGRSTPTSSSQTTVYIRWILPEQAISCNFLSELEVDKCPVSLNTSLSVLKELAYNRLLAISPESVLLNTTAEIFLESTYLACKGAAKLSDLDLHGTIDAPLNIFMVPFRIAPTDSSLQKHWGFECSERGAATFVTCLEVLLNEIQQNPTSLDGFLESFLGVSLFPPAVLAFRELYQFGISKIKPLPVAIIATVLRDLSVQIVPPWIAQSHPTQLLEASRQVFYWLHLLNCGSTCGQLSIYQVTIEEARSNIDFSGVRPELDQRYYETQVEIPRIRNRFTSPAFKKVYITMERSLRRYVKPDFIAMALDGAYESRGNFVFAYNQELACLYDRIKIATPNYSEFDNFLQTANAAGPFKMIGPIQLANCTSSSLPVITLCSKGYVSLYNQRDMVCGDRYFYTTNTVEETETMPPDANQYLLQKLEPIIAERKKDRSWEVDAWAQDINTQIDLQNPDEAIVICVDLSSSMPSQMPASWNLKTQHASEVTTEDQLSRLTEVKEIFKQLVSGISVHNLSTYLGLVTFSSRNKIYTEQKLSPVILNFQDRLIKLNASGQTALWDAMLLASNMLIASKEEFPKSKLRMIVLTDGEENDSMAIPGDICKRLYTQEIIMDAIVIGTDKTKELFKIAKHTGGYAFCPQSRSSLFQLFLLETMLDIKTRPDITREPVVDYASSTPKQPDMTDKFDIPSIRPHPNQNDNFFSARDAARHLNRTPRTGSVTSYSTTSAASTVLATPSTIGNTEALLDESTNFSRRDPTRLYLSEVQAAIQDQHPFIDIYVSETNVGFWKVVMQGPPDSPYAAGVFVLYIDITEDFPRRPPSARFITPIIHPNITKHGRICHPIFNREWEPRIKVNEVLQHVWRLLMSLEPRDAVDPMFTLTFWTDPTSACWEAKEYIKKFASESRQWHRAEILSCSIV